jgi:hypothetical protein
VARPYINDYKISHYDFADLRRNKVQGGLRRRHRGHREKEKEEGGPEAVLRMKVRRKPSDVRN